MGRGGGQQLAACARRNWPRRLRERAARLLSIVLSRSSCIEIRRRRRTSTALCDSLRKAVGDTSPPLPSRSMGPPLLLAAPGSGLNGTGVGAAPLGRAPPPPPFIME